MRTLTFSLSPLAPFRLDLTALALRRRPINMIDVWNGETYSRILSLDDIPLLIEVRQSGGNRSPRLRVQARAQQMPSDARGRITRQLELLLGLRINLRPFYRRAKSDPRLSKLTMRFMGLKPPRFPSVFEGIANGIACQQLSLHVGLMLLNRLTEKAGLPFETPAGTRYAFPRPQDVAECPMRTLCRLGFSTNKAKALRQLSKDVVRGHFDSEGLAQLGNEQAMERLLTVRGIGRWTGEYVLLRGIGRTDIFPADDVGARNNLAKWLSIKDPLNYDSVKRAVAKWHPYSGLIYFHLLLDSLAKTGLAGQRVAEDHHRAIA
jgi:DNA-3-methyladenine glycosylase II